MTVKDPPIQGATSAIARPEARQASAIAVQQTVKPPQTATTAQPTQEAIKQAMDHANKVLSAKVIDDLQFSVDKDTNIQVVRLINRKSGETVMQMPSAEMLKIAKSIDQFVGALIQKTA